MDIICASCGVHLSSIEVAREHSKSCTSRNLLTDVPIQWIRPKRGRVSAQQWQNIVDMIEATPSPKKTTEELATYFHPDGSFEQSNEYARKVKNQEPRNLHSKGEHSVQPKAVDWSAIGIIIFVIVMLVIVGWAR